MKRELKVRPPALLVAAVAVFLAAAACGGGEKETTVSVSLSEWSVSPSVSSVKAGKVTFAASNAGTVDHELVVIKTDRAPDALVVKAAESKVDEAASGSLTGKIDAFGPGKTGSKQFQLDKGKYVLFCNVAAHYTTGMRAAFTVQ